MSEPSTRVARSATSQTHIPSTSSVPPAGPCAPSHNRKPLPRTQPKDPTPTNNHIRPDAAQTGPPTHTLAKAQVSILQSSAQRLPARPLRLRLPPAPNPQKTTQPFPPTTPAHSQAQAPATPPLQHRRQNPAPPPRVTESQPPTPSPRPPPPPPAPPDRPARTLASAPERGHRHSLHATLASRPISPRRHSARQGPPYHLLSAPPAPTASP